LGRIAKAIVEKVQILKLKYLWRKTLTRSISFEVEFFGTIFNPYIYRDVQGRVAKIVTRISANADAKWYEHCR
jgi:hypothetical protein